MDILGIIWDNLGNDIYNEIYVYIYINYIFIYIYGGVHSHGNIFNTACFINNGRSRKWMISPGGTLHDLGKLETEIFGEKRHKTQKKTKSGHVVIGIHFILNDLSKRKIPPCFVRNDRRVLGGELPMDPR